MPKSRWLAAAGFATLSLALSGAAAAQGPAWVEKNLAAEGLLNGQGELLSRQGEVLADNAGNPLKPDCAFGVPGGYRFFVQPGDPAKLLLFHDGGGACWESNTCASPLVSNTPTFDPTISESPGSLALAGGVLDANNDANPFKSWTKVYIPYCTGDVGWGNKTTIYQTQLGPLPVNHRGYANVRAVLRWMENAYANQSAPSKVVVSGASAGAYAASGTLFPELAKALPASTRTYVIADSGNGVVTDSFLSSAAQNWGIGGTLPPYLLPVLAQGAQGLPVRFYGELTRRFRATRFGQYQNAYDSIQTVVYNTMKYSDDPSRWTDLQFLLPSLIEWTANTRLATNLSALAPNYRYYTAAGSEHVVLVSIPPEAQAGFCSDDFYSESSAGGLSFRNWVNAMVNGGGFLWNTGSWRNASCFPNCYVPPRPGCEPAIQ